LGLTTGQLFVWISAFQSKPLFRGLFVSYQSGFDLPTGRPAAELFGELIAVSGCLKITSHKFSVARQLFVQLGTFESWESKIPLKAHLALTTNKRFCATWA
jgi:hypothetical protein